MPLIVAIEPDGRQAALLLKLARGPLNAKLVVAESTERAFDAFREGVPDLILTSRRLSKKDEKALADRLKSLAGAAAHVQRLAIPVFAPPGPARGKKHIARMRRSSNNLTEGCDPEIFAEQIAEYLELAAAERALIDAGTVAPACHHEPLGAGAAAPATRPAARSSAWTRGSARSRRSAFREQRDSAFSRPRRRAVSGHQRASMRGRSRRR